MYLFAFIHLLAARSGIVCSYIGLFVYLSIYIWRTKQWKKAGIILVLLAGFIFLSPNLFPTLKRKINYTIYDLNKFRENNIRSAENYAEFISLIEAGGFIRCGWDGDSASEAAIKAETKATIRCILPDENVDGKNCIYSGNPAKHEVIFARAY